MYFLYDDCGSDGAPDPAELRAAQKLGGNDKYVSFEQSLQQHPALWATLREQASARAPGAKAEFTADFVASLRDSSLLHANHAGGGAARRLDDAWNGVSYPCGNNAALSAFLKDSAVMEALHVNKTKSGQSYRSTAQDLRPLYKELAAKSVRAASRPVLLLDLDLSFYLHAKKILIVWYFFCRAGTRL